MLTDEDLRTLHNDGGVNRDAAEEIYRMRDYLTPVPRSERMPPIGARVLTWGEVPEDGQKWAMNEVSRYGFDRNNEFVTHWLLAPEDAPT